MDSAHKKLTDVGTTAAYLAKGVDKGKPTRVS